MKSYNKHLVLVICIFFGYLGIHRFYIGKKKSGLLYLFTLGVFGIGWIVDIILILTDKFIPKKTTHIQIVYTTLNSEIYHYNPHCYGMVDAINIDLDKARAIGLRPCNRCCHR